ncbi:MAG TPA: helix-turn-helix transcriptional regulator [Pseudolysinimonas sp.]|nr:helix-turn-helix transcriptional regulator [Pseudolysinimonas sp.]
MLLRHVTGAALRRIRWDEGRTLREVSQAANISMPYLSEIERGRKEPSSEILAGICTALGLTLVDLLHEVTAEAVVIELTSSTASPAAMSPAPPSASVTAITSGRGSEIGLAVAA